MNLYLLSQDANSGYDTYDSVVVAAESENEARLITPDCGSSEEHWLDSSWRDWAYTPDQVSVELIGVAADGTPSGVILASYHAG